ncbi:MAG: ABC transporter substrate-binding protein [Burkholderiales bacterium]
MNRRDTVIAIAALGMAPLAARAQQPGKVWRVGFLAVPSRPDNLEAHQFGQFVRGMRELGYVEGKNLVIEWRFAESKVERLPALAAELAQWKPDAIVGAANTPAIAAQKVMPTVPIVMVGPGDPVGTGLIKSLARPGGNVTGVSSMTGDLGPKRLELLHTMVPKLTRVAVLVLTGNPGQDKSMEVLRAVGEKLRLTILRVDASTPKDVESAFPAMLREKAGALIVTLQPIFQEQRFLIAQLSAKHRLPTMTPDRVYTEAGCLMSYGNSLHDMYHRAAYYVDKIFKGANPAELPVEQPTRFELLINGKTAKGLGLKIPQELLLQADKVME